MFKKKEKPIKEKKIRTMKVGTHKKSVIALWVVLIASVSFGVYKNFTAIDQHTMHEIETIQLRLNEITASVETPDPNISYHPVFNINFMRLIAIFFDNIALHAISRMKLMLNTG